MRFPWVTAPLLLFVVAIATTCAQDSEPVAKPFERTPERVARGKYIVLALGHCFNCHSERGERGSIVRGMEGAGRVLPQEESDVPLPQFLVCPNITPDRETAPGHGRTPN